MTIRTTTENDNDNNDAATSPATEPSNVGAIHAAVVEVVSVDAEVVTTSDDNNNHGGGSAGDVVDVPLGIPEAQAYPVNDIESNVGASGGATNSNGAYDRTAPVTISITKPPSGGRFGIGIKDVNGNLYISYIKETSPFWNTTLRVGHLILEINGVSCQDLSPAEAASLLPQSSGDNRTTIKVMEPRQSVVSIAPTATATAATVTAEASALPPPGAPAGGTWTTEKFKPVFAIAMSIICCIAGFFFWPAWCFVCCALAAHDTRRVYVVNGVKYLANGARI